MFLRFISSNYWNRFQIKIQKSSNVLHGQPSPYQVVRVPPEGAHLAVISPLATPWPTRPQAMPARLYSRNLTPTHATLEQGGGGGLMGRGPLPKVWPGKQMGTLQAAPAFKTVAHKARRARSR